MGRKNLNLQLAVHTAKAGYKPNIDWAKSVAKKEQMREKENCDSRDVLKKLRVEKIKSKLFHYQKQANKIAKKEKTLLVRKLARRLKELTAKDLKTMEKRAKALSQLEEAKKIDLMRLGADFLCHVVQSDESVWNRVKDHVQTGEQSTTSSLFAGVPSYKKEQQSMLTDIKAFLTKLFIDQVSEEKAEIVPQVASGKGTDPYFVESLNQVDGSDFSADSDGEDLGTGDSDDGSSNQATKKKKNRLGQRARRELWEQKYGDKANHVRKAKNEKKKKAFRDEPNPKAKILKPVGKPAADLHPSWAAKLEQKKRLQETSSSAPTRILFDS